LPEVFVVDCSVAEKWVLPETGAIPALRLLREEQLGEVSLLAPDLLLVELAKKVRRKQISPEQALEGFRFMQTSVLRPVETGPLLGPALDLALNHPISLWDSVYLALAIQQDCPLITADRRLFRGGRGRHPSIRLLDDR
jgi:predicted nucleic acid-binding protein